MQKFLVYFFILLFYLNAYSEEYELVSPNKTAKFRINIGETISYSVFYKDKAIIQDSPFSLGFTQSASYEKDFIVKDKTYCEINENKTQYSVYGNINPQYLQIIFLNFTHFKKDIIDEGMKSWPGF